MAGIRDEVELDVTAALASIDQIGASLDQQVAQFQVSLSNALDTLRNGPQVDTSAISTGVSETQKFASAWGDVAVGAEAAGVATAGVGSALSSLAALPVISTLAAAFGTKELVDGLNSATQSAANLDLQLKQVPTVFGPAAASILAFGQTSVTQLALSEQAAISLSNNFGRLFTGQGISQQQSAKLTEEIVQRASDLATVTGRTTDEVITKLSGGLVGQSRAVRDLGAAYSVTEVKTEAAKLGFQAVNGVFDEGALIQARAAIILDKTSYAQGQLAANSDSLLVKQRTLTAEWQNASAQLGQALIPAALQLVTALEAQIPTFEKLAGSLIPALITVFESLLPILSSFASILGGLSPVIKIIADVFAALPGPVREAAIAFVLLGTGIGPLPNLLTQFKVAAVASGEEGLGAMTAGFAGMNPYVLAAIVAIPVLTALMGSHNAQQQATAATVKQTATAYADLTKAVSDETLAEVQAAANQTLKDSFVKAGVTFSDLSKAIEGGSVTLDAFIRHLQDTGNLNVQSLGSLKEVIDGIETGAKNAIDTLVLTKQVTQDVATAAEKANTSNGFTNWVAALKAIRPAATDATAGVTGLGGAADSTAGSLADLDKALKDVKAGLDDTFAKYLDAADAVGTLQDATAKLGDEIGKGPAKGQPFLLYLDQVGSDLRGVVKDVEANALAMARAGQITGDQASVTAEMVKELQDLGRAFPGLDSQIQQYIALLIGIPKEIDTKLVVFAESIANTNPNLAGVINAQGFLTAQEQGKQLAGSLATGITQNIGAVASAGQAAGAAAASAAAAKATSVLKSAGSGFDIGGFLVQGIILDPAQKQQQDLNNFFAGMVKNIGSTVADAVRIDPSEQSAILSAVEKVAQDTAALGKARHDLGANSIEAAVAAAQLATDEAAVNTVILKATDSTDAYTAALKKLSDGVNVVESSLRGLFTAREAAASVDAARQNLQKDQLDYEVINADIQHNTELLKEATAARIASGQATPSIQERRLQSTILDLQNQGNASQQKIITDQDAVVKSQLDLVDAQQKLVDIGAQVNATSGNWQAYFQELATQAGLSQSSVQGLLDTLTKASQTASAIHGNVVGATPGAIGTNPVPGATGPAAQQATLLSAPGTQIGPIYFTLPAGSDNQTGQQVVNDLRSVAAAQ